MSNSSIRLQSCEGGDMTHFTRITTLGFLIATCLATPVQAANVAGVVEHSDGIKGQQPSE